MALATSAGGKSINFVLSGMIVGIAISSITTLLITSSQNNRLHGALFWLYGSFAYMSWTKALLIIIPVLMISIVLLMFARELNVILLGDEHAKHLGLNVRSFKRTITTLVSVLTAVSVAFCGIIGFLGLIVPPDHQSRGVGAIALVAADIVARVIIRPNELPIGAVVSLVGAPFFIYLMIRRGKEYGG